MMGISRHHLATGSRNSLRCLIPFALTLTTLLLAAVCTPHGVAAWEPHFFFIRAFSPMPLGNYANTSVQLGANTTITPDAAPTATTSINVSTSTDFKGLLEGNPTTGVVRVTDAHPAGTYTVTVTAFDGGPTTKAFTLTVTTPTTCSPVAFSSAASFAAGNGPFSMAVADFNGDGKQDLATANFNSANVSVLLGNGAGSFGAATNFGVGTSPFPVAVGDFNGDGKQDLATGNFDSANVSVLLGNGAGSFSAATNFGVGNRPVSLAVGDFNGDGKQDFAVANLDSNNVSVLLGNGAGSFSAATNFGLGTSPRFVVVGDFNGDGKQDLAVAKLDANNVSILLGNGSGGFSAATNFSVGTNPQSVAVGDFNGDGKPDLAVANGTSSNVSVLVGNGAGGFSAATSFAVGTDPVSVAVGDFNGDGKLDLTVANFNSNNLSVLLGDGAGSFSPATNFGVGTNPRWVTVGDFTGDGKQDLAVANTNSNNVSVLLRQCPPPTLGNYANTSVQLGANTTITPDAAPTGTTSINVSTSTNFKGRLEGDPTTGIVRVTDAHPAGSYTIEVRSLNGAGGSTTKTFPLTVTTPFATCNPVTFASAATFAAGITPASVAVGDFNGDGKQDLAVANFNSDDLSVFLGNGAGGFGAANSSAIVASPISVAVGDFNGDGKQDLAIANGNTPSASVLLGNGTGSFGAATNFPLSNPSKSVAVGDFNGDGAEDLAVISSSFVAILLGNGAGGFSAAVNFGAGTSPESVAVGDFNGDGKQDLVVTTSSFGLVLLGNGGGGFGPPLAFGASNGGRSVAVGDFNGDGKQDLAIANNFLHNVSVSLGNGAGSFSAAGNFGVGETPESIALGDFNGDGKQDLATANFNSNSVSVLLGNGGGSFNAAINFDLGNVVLSSSPRSLAVGDFNGDGKQDFATANDGSDNVSVLLRSCPLPTTIPVNNTKDSGPGSLRQAILDANTSTGTTDTITFNIPGPGIHTFTLLSALDITDPLIIDGYTQPGANANTLAVGNDATLLIELNGNDGNYSGLNITGGGSTVRGLVINRFGDSGIRLSGLGRNAVGGCFIGTAPGGMTARSNGVGVAVVSSPSNTIGGTTPAARNIISGNRTAGIQLGEAGKPATLNNSIRGNYIGTNATGNGPLGNGNNPAGGNGIFIPARATGAMIQANRIAYNTGNVSSGTGNGVRIPTPAGGETPGTQIEITENEIFGNGGMGIDLGPPGITPNDPGDPDVGPNFLQNFPTLTSFLPLSTGGRLIAGNDWLSLKGAEVRLTAATSFTVVSQLNSTPNSTFTVHWYFSADAQCTTNQAASVPLDFGKVADVMTNCNGYASFSFPFAFQPGITSGIINATATDQQGNTSEFSSCLPVSATPPWQPAVLTSPQIEQIKAWTIGGITYVYVKPKFPDAGYRVADWGQVMPSGKNFTVDASVERFTGISIQSIVTTAHIYDLGAIPAGNYTFTFKNSGTTVQSLTFDVGGSVMPNLIDQASDFVISQYLDFLSRPPDDPGLKHWTAEITQCSDPLQRNPGETEPKCVERKRANTSAAFFVSPEFQNTGYFVLRVYRGSLGRMPFFGGSGDAAKNEFTRDAATLAAGIVVNNQLDPGVINTNKQDFTRQFVLRPEFRGIYDPLCNSQYVDKLFQITGVTPTADQRQALIDELDANAADARANVLFKVVDGTTTKTGGALVFNTPYGEAFYNQQFNPGFVQMEYFGYLRRDPDADGYVFWLGKLDQFGNWNDAEMVLSFISSPEYRARFGQP